jgi:hypothetical protein
LNPEEKPTLEAGRTQFQEKVKGAWNKKLGIPAASLSLSSPFAFSVGNQKGEEKTQSACRERERETWLEKKKEISSPKTARKLLAAKGIMHDMLIQEWIKMVVVVDKKEDGWRSSSTYPQFRLSYQVSFAGKSIRSPTAIEWSTLQPS